MDNDVYYDGEPTLPLGIMACGLKKLESFHHDLDEILEDEEVDNLSRELFEGMRDQTRWMMRCMVAIAGREIPEEDFLAEVDMMSDISET